MTKKIKIPTTLALVSSLFFITNANAQENERTAHYSSVPLSHINVSAGFSTLGTSIEVATPLASHLKVRAGVNFFNKTSHDSTIDLNDPSGTLKAAFGEEVSYAANLNIKTFHTNILVDYYPFEKGIFHITGGLYIGETKISARGRVVDRSGNDAQLQPGYDWPELDFDGRVISINEGRINAELTLGNKVKPYLGIGLGRVISKKRFGVRFEAGVMYAGDYKITQNGNSLPVSSSDINNFTDVDKYKDYLKYYPMVKLQLTYRIL